MTELQQRVWQKLSLLGEGPAAFFRDACTLVERVHANEWLLPTATHLVSHLLRELESSVRDVLYAQLVVPSQAIPSAPTSELQPGLEVGAGGIGDPSNTSQRELSAADRGDVAERCDDQDSRQSHLQQIKAILRTLKFPEQSPELKRWKALERGSLSLHRGAHRDALSAPRPLTEAFVRAFDETVELLNAVLGRFERTYATVYDQLDALLTIQSPTSADVAVLRTRVPNTPRTLAYFFGRLQHPDWLDPLRGAGYFVLPATGRDAAGRQILALWPAAQYLARVAPLRPQSVAEVVRGLLDTDDPNIRTQVIEILLALRPSDRAEMAPAVERWIADLERSFWADHATRFAAALLTDGATDLALSVIARILGLPPGWPVTGTTPREASYWGDERHAWRLRSLGETLFPNAAVAAPLEALSLLAGGIDFHVGRVPGEVGADPSAPAGLTDYSPLWAERLGEPEGLDNSDLRAFLVYVLRQQLRLLAARRPDLLEAALRSVGAYGARVLRRVDLAVLSDSVQSEAEETRSVALPLAVSRLVSPELVTEPDLNREYAAVLRVAFPAALEADRERILAALVPPSFEWVGNPDEVQRYRARWRRDRLAIVADFLPARQRGELEALVLSEGKPEPLEHPRAFVTTSYGDRSPLDDEALQAMGLDQLLGFLETWRPSADFRASTRESLAQGIQAVVEADAAGHADWAPRFIGQHPAYVSGVLNAFRTATRSDAVFPWGPVLDLAEWAASKKPVTSEGATGAPTSDGDDSWRYVRLAVADMLGAALGRAWDEAGALPIDERDRVWRIISTLAEDENPSPAYEARWGGPNMEPSTLALNTVRPEAVDAVIRFAYWSAQHSARSTSGLAHVLQRESAVGNLLERRLNPANDTSLAVRAAVGRWLTPLARTDPEWVTAHRELLLPDSPEASEMRDALWDAFVQWSRPHPDALPVLDQAYREAIDRLRPLAEEREERSRSAERAEDRLAEHVVALYWWGAIALDAPDNLVTYFFERADLRRRAHALQHVGFSLFHAEGPIDGEVLLRLQRLWDWRFAQLRAAPDLVQRDAALSPGTVRETRSGLPSEDARLEVAEFGWSFAAGMFEPAWALGRLKEVLQANGDVQLSHEVVQRLVELAPQEARRVAECVAHVDFTGGEEPWTAHAWVEHLPAIIKPALRASDPAVAALGREVVNRAIAAGHTDLRQLLEEPEESANEPDGDEHRDK